MPSRRSESRNRRALSLANAFAGTRTDVEELLRQSPESKATRAQAAIDCRNTTRRPIRGSTTNFPLQSRIMRTAMDIFDQPFLEMRWRCLSLAADLDRVGQPVDDERMTKLRMAIEVLLRPEANRAAPVQMIFSDQTPPPARNPR